MPFAVVLTGGKQYKVAVGDKIRVEKLAAEHQRRTGRPHVDFLGTVFIDPPDSILKLCTAYDGILAEQQTFSEIALSAGFGFAPPGTRGPRAGICIGRIRRIIQR